MISNMVLKRSLALLVLITILLATYDFMMGRELMAVRNKVTTERQTVKTMRMARNKLVTSGKDRATPTSLARARANKATATPEIDRLELLRAVAGESEVEIVNLLENATNGRIGTESSYHMGVRADMAKLIAFLQTLEQKGLNRVVIDRVAAKRCGDVWDTNLQVTSYFWSQPTSRRR